MLVLEFYCNNVLYGRIFNTRLCSTNSSKSSYNLYGYYSGSKQLQYLLCKNRKPRFPRKYSWWFAAYSYCRGNSNMFIKSEGLHLIITFAGIIIFTGFLVFDLNRLYDKGDQDQMEDPMLAAVGIYLDIVNLPFTS